MRMALITASAMMLVVLVGCVGDPTAQVDEHSSSEPEASRPPTASSSPSSQEQAASTAGSSEVSFTYTCYIAESDGSYVEIDRELLSWAESWAHVPSTVSCSAIKHGTEYTELQREAVAVAGDVLPGGIEQLDALYAQCAIRDNGYLRYTSLAPNQAQEVRAFLILCPDRPGSETLRAALGT
jgi:hypothetical protein